MQIEKLFCVKKDGRHLLLKFCGVSLRIKYGVNYKKFLDFQRNKVIKNTILIIEPNDCHYETILGYYKYLNKLGFAVEVLTRGNCWNLFLNSGFNIKVWECHDRTFDFIYEHADFSKYYCLFFNSKRIYWKNNNANNDGYDIEKTYEKIPRGQNENIYVQHHIDMWCDCEQEKQILLANPTGNSRLNNNIVNPHYFGKVSITNKNEKITKFITVGGLSIARRNSNLLIEAVKAIHKSGINNFEINVISSDKVEMIPEEIRKYFRFWGRADFPTMFKAMEEADYFLPLLDPQIEKHQRYMKYGTSGSFQLIYGFLKPCIIHKTFADIYGFSEEDSIVYENNADLSKSMQGAIFLSQKEYANKQNKLADIVKNIEEKSMQNLRSML